MRHCNAVYDAEEVRVFSTVDRAVVVEAVLELFEPPPSLLKQFLPNLHPANEGKVEL